MSVQLRPLTAADATTIASWGTDGDFCDAAEWSRDVPPDELEAFHRRLATNPPSDLLRLGAWHEGRLVGYVDLQGSELHRRELGVVVGERSLWGQGIGTSLVTAGLRHGFDVLGLAEVWAEAWDTNAASVRMLRRAGMRDDGPGEPGIYRDAPAVALQFSLRRDEFPAAAPAPRDCTFDEDGRWFRLRACGIIVDEQGRVLMAANPRDPYLYSVGGGVHHGESLEDAARRELREETGVECELGPLAVIHESFFGDELLPGRQCHELAFYYLATPSGPIATGPDHPMSATLDELDEHLEWVDPASIGTTVTAHPGFFATELPSLLAGEGLPRRIVTRE